VFLSQARAGRHREALEYSFHGRKLICDINDLESALLYFFILFLIYSSDSAILTG
jgi:hypothetical protein